MLEGVAGQRAQRFDFAHRGEPAPNRRARFAPPILHCECQVGGPEQERLGHAHHDVVARIQVLDQPAEPGHAPGRRTAGRVERLPQCGQQGRVKALVFQPDQRLREQPQFVRRFFHRRDHGSRFLPETIKKRPVDEERNQEEIAQQRGETLRQPQNPQVARVEGEESRQAEQSQRGQRPRPGLRESRGEQRRRFAPGSQRHGIDAGAGLFRQDGQLFAQIHARPQLLHRPLPREHRGGSGGSEQPSRQRVFPNVSSRRGDQLEERTFPEQVEIPRVRMGRIQVAVAGLSGSSPAPVETRQPALEEPRRAPPPFQHAQDPLMPHRQGDEHHQRDGRPHHRHGALE